MTEHDIPDAKELFTIIAMTEQAADQDLTAEKPAADFANLE